MVSFKEATTESNWMGGSEGEVGGASGYLPFEQTLDVSGCPELSVSLSWIGFECNDRSRGPGLGDLPRMIAAAAPSAGPLRMSVIMNRERVAAVWGMALASSCTVMPLTVLDTFSPTANTLGNIVKKRNTRTGHWRTPLIQPSQSVSQHSRVTGSNNNILFVRPSVRPSVPSATAITLAPINSWVKLIGIVKRSTVLQRCSCKLTSKRCDVLSAALNQPCCVPHQKNHPHPGRRSNRSGRPIIAGPMA